MYKSLAFLALVGAASLQVSLAGDAAATFGDWGKHTVWGINYNAERDEFNCPTSEQIESDLELVKDVTSRIRIYALQGCEIDGRHQGERVLRAAQKVGLDIWLGLWANDQPQVIDTELALLKSYAEGEGGLDNVIGVSVGSESIYRGELNADQVISNVERAMDLLKSEGYEDVPVTGAEIYDNYTTAMIDAFDLTFTNGFPYWEGVPVEEAVGHLVYKVSDMAELTASKDKLFVFSESGWPAKGSNFGASVASEENEQIYFAEFVCTMKEKGWPFFYFAAFNDNIQREPGDVEGSFGIFNAERTALNDWITIPDC